MALIAGMGSGLDRPCIRLAQCSLTILEAENSTRSSPTIVEAEMHMTLLVYWIAKNEHAPENSFYVFLHLLFQLCLLCVVRSAAKPYYSYRPAILMQHSPGVIPLLATRVFLHVVIASTNSSIPRTTLTPPPTTTPHHTTPQTDPHAPPSRAATNRFVVLCIFSRPPLFLPVHCEVSIGAPGAVGTARRAEAGRTGGGTLGEKGGRAGGRGAERGQAGVVGGAGGHRESGLGGCVGSERGQLPSRRGMANHMTLLLYDTSQRSRPNSNSRPQVDKFLLF